MIGISKLYMGQAEASDPLRYGRMSARLPSHLLQFSKDKKPIVVWNVTQRCNLRCRHCYAAGTPDAARELTTAECLRAIDGFADFGCPVVLFSGGEPFMQPEFLIDALDACGAQGYHRCVDTCGFTQKRVIVEAAKRTDLFLYDIKHMDPEEHKKYTGVDNVVILENLAAISEAGANINVRIPFMPGLNSSDENMRAIGKFVAPLRGVVGVNILPYHTVAKGKHERWHMEYKLNDLMPPTENQTHHAAEILESYGLKVHIGG